MVATVDIIEQDGSGTASFTAKTSGTIRFKSAIGNDADANDPLTVPATGQAFSYDKYLALRIGDTGPTDKISNIRFYTDGGDGWTNVNLYVTSTSTFTTQLRRSTISGFTDAFTYTSGSPLTLNAGTLSATNTRACDFALCFMTVDSNATPGTLTSETLTFSYDEV